MKVNYVPDRAFPRRLIDGTDNVTKRHHTIRMLCSWREIWLSFLTPYNGVALMLDD